MKLTKTPSVVLSSAFQAYTHNCQRNAKCELPFTAPVPGLPYTQVYVDFGAYQPLFVELKLQDACDLSHSEQIFASNYVVGQTPEGGWYGVFKYFNSPMVPVTDFVIWMSATVSTPSGLQEQTYFSEVLTVEVCAPLMKVKSCHPEDATTTGFDINGLYYGLPVGDDFLGMDTVRYFHIAYVRNGKARELPPKVTFTSSLYKNFRTTVEKTWSLECEIVPKWFKDELLAIHSRGAVQLDEDKTYLVSDLAYEAVADDDLMWKPFAQLKETTRLYYGCDDGVCVDCCSPVIISAVSEHGSESDSGSMDSPSDSGGDSPSDSGSPGPDPGEGNITVLANCGTTEHQINAVRFVVPPAVDPELAGDPDADYPVLPGESRDVAFVSMFGTGDLQVYFDEDIFPLTVRVTDSMGNSYCANSVSGPGIDNVITFPGIIISNTPLQVWTVELSCTPCA